MKDVELYRLFKIPLGTVYDWKHRKDYRFLMYSFFKSMTTKDVIDIFSRFSDDVAKEAQERLNKKA